MTKQSDIKQAMDFIDYTIALFWGLSLLSRISSTASKQRHLPTIIETILIDQEKYYYKLLQKCKNKFLPINKHLYETNSEYSNIAEYIRACTLF